MTSRKSETSSARGEKPDKAAVALKSYRAQIDKLDVQILDLINKRASLAGEIGRVKNENGGEIFSPAREEEVLQNVLQANKGPLDATTVRAIYREIMSGSRALQRMIKVAFLGPEFSFSHLATLQRFGHDVELQRVGSIAAVFEEVNRRHTDFGVVPLENSTDGRVADTLDMFIQMPQIKICSEVRMRIHHNLLANCEQPEIRRVYSKGQALSQCRAWLAKNVAHASLHEVSSTADAAALAQREPGAAAIASRQAAVRYGLRILSNDIEDSPYNETRFAVIGTQEVARTGKDKTAVMFQVPNSPGSLADVLGIFKQQKINLTWVESYPYRSVKSEYVFFVEFEGHQEDPKVRRALSALQATCEQLTVLGSFPAATVVED
jgi:chorismate mutase/prephenate dehydratase